MMSIDPFQPGLVSITFRLLSPQQIIELVLDAKLGAIEWGGDVHVPHGDERAAELVAKLCRDAGLHMPTYGSYYKLAHSQAAGPRFDEVLRSAVVLGTPLIRVWAGTKSSSDTTAEERRAIEDDLQRICDLAAPHHIGITLEYHAGTLTDDADSCLALIRAVHRPNLTTLWQTTNGRDADFALSTLKAVKPHLSHLHVFHWGKGGWNDKHPLADGSGDWHRYLTEARDPSRPRCCMLEFVRGDSTDQLLRDADTLREWLHTFHATNTLHR